MGFWMNHCKYNVSTSHDIAEHSYWAFVMQLFSIGLLQIQQLMLLIGDPHVVEIWLELFFSL